MSNLLSQKQEIKRLEKEFLRKREEEQDQRRREDDVDHEKEVKEFEMVQAGLEVKLGSGKKVIGRKDGKVVIEEETKGTKRKFSVDQDELKRIGEDSSSRKRKTEDAKPSLPSFWVPSETPKQNITAAVKPTKLNPICPASEPDQPHEFSLKTIVSVIFTEEKDAKTGDTVRSCPSCRKALSNSTKAILAKPCGHVVCKPCGDKFLKPAEKHAHNDDAEVGVVRCYVCQANVTEKKREKREGKDKEKEKVRPGLVEVSSEGTGFAGGGKNMIKRSGVAFQC